MTLMNPRAQGTIEYLIIIAVVVVIALVVVGMMTGFLNPAAGISSSSSQIGALTGSLGVTESLVEPVDGNFVVRLLNNSGEYITVSNVRVGQASANFSEDLVQGASKFFRVDSNVACGQDKIVSEDVTVTYLTVNGLTKTQTFNDKIMFDCAPYVIELANLASACPACGASCTGDATADKVLNGYTFSNALSTGLAGTYVPASTVPGAPTIGTATPGNASATVTFTAPASDGGSPITGYTVTSTPGGGIDLNAGTAAMSHTVANLANWSSYTFKAAASNANGTSLPSGASGSVTPIIPMPTAGLLSFFPFDGNANSAGGTMTITGALNGGTALAPGLKGMANTAYSFNGTNAYIQLSQILPIAGSDYTISLWMKTTSNIDGWVFSQSDSPGNQLIGVSYAGASGAHCIGHISYNFGYSNTMGTIPVNNGSWHHVVTTKTGTTGRSYIDNVLDISSGTLRNVGTTTIATFGARKYSTVDIYYTGALDSIRVYNRALSADEISAIYNTEKP